MTHILLTNDDGIHAAGLKALAAGLERTRWHDLAGIIAAVGALAVIAGLTQLPLHLLPTAIIGMTDGQHRQWTAAWQLWAAVGAAAAAVTGWAVGDPWRRLAARIAPR